MPLRGPLPNPQVTADAGRRNQLAKPQHGAAGRAVLASSQRGGEHAHPFLGAGRRQDDPRDPEPRAQLEDVVRLQFQPLELSDVGAPQMEPAPRLPYDDRCAAGGEIDPGQRRLGDLLEVRRGRLGLAGPGDLGLAHDHERLAVLMADQPRLPEWDPQGGQHRERGLQALGQLLHRGEGA